MRIAVVVNSFPVISEAFIVRQAEKLEAHVITLEYNENVADKYNLSLDKIHLLNANKKQTFIEKGVNRLRGIRFRTWSRIERNNFKKLLIDMNIEVVLAAFGPNGINVMESCLALNIPYVVQFLGYDASSLLSFKYYQNRIVDVINKSKASVVLYNGMEKRFIELGARKEKFHVINIGVPTQKFQNIKPDFHKNGTTNFIAVGRLVRKKSPINILKAFLICVKNNPQIKLDLVGDGELMPAVKEFLKNNPVLSDKVILHGFLSQKELSKLYLQAHIFLQHSVTSEDGNKEGWPVSIAEACASSLPVIATKHAGISEQIVHGETGYLVEEGDFESMGNYMSVLASDWGLAKEMGEKGKEHIFNHGDLDQQVSKLKALLENNKK